MSELDEPFPKTDRNWNYLVERIRALEAELAGTKDAFMNQLMKLDAERDALKEQNEKTLRAWLEDKNGFIILCKRLQSHMAKLERQGEDCPASDWHHLKGSARKSGGKDH